MQAAKRSHEFGAVQRDNRRVAAELRKVLASASHVPAPSPVQGGSAESPSPSGGHFAYLEWEWRLITLGADTVSDRRNSRLR